MTLIITLRQTWSTQTQVIDGKFGRVLSWYDNEWFIRMCDTAVAMKRAKRMLDVGSIKKLEDRNKTVLVRFDLNVPLDEVSGKVNDRLTRIKNNKSIKN